MSEQGSEQQTSAMQDGNQGGEHQPPRKASKSSDQFFSSAAGTPKKPPPLEHLAGRIHAGYKTTGYRTDDFAAYLSPKSAAAIAARRTNPSVLTAEAQKFSSTA